MKKILFGLIAVLGFSAAVNAQITDGKSKSISAADTLIFYNVGSKAKAIQYTFTEASGTTAGKIILEGSIDGSWVGLDSLTLVDGTFAQNKVTVFTAMNYLNLRLRCTNTSSATGTFKAAILRRPDE